MILQLDPSAVAEERTMFDLNSGSVIVDEAGIDWGDAAIQAFLADQLWGSVPVDSRVPNRIVTIPLVLGADDAGTEEVERAQLQQKIGLIQREQGWLLRQRDFGPAMYADVINATLNIPDLYGETAGVEGGVKLTLECLPDFYGDEITLDSISASGDIAQVLELSGAQAVIEGDYPARCRIVLTDTSGNDQRGLLWGLRSRHYSSDSRAALILEAEDLTPLNGAAVISTGAVPSGHVVDHTTLPTGVWVPVLAMNLLTEGLLTHRGSYRVWARAYAQTGTAQFRLAWGAGSVANPVINDAISIPAASDYCLVDLGQVIVGDLVVGDREWTGIVQVQLGETAEVAIDKLYLQPLNESAGRLAYAPVGSPSTVSYGRSPTTLADDASIGSIAWSIPGFGGIAQTGNGGAVALSNYVKLTDFGFNVPAGATITGIEVQVGKTSNGGSGFYVNDAHVQLIKAGTIQAADRSSGGGWPFGGGAPFGYGGSTDLWGFSWGPSDINDSGFGVALAVNLFNAGAYLRSVEIIVYYTLAPGFTVDRDAVVYGNRPAELRTDGMLASPGGGVYGQISKQFGDLPRLPPSGLEGRPVELFVKASEGNLDDESDPTFDAFTAQVIYRPCWLSRP